MIIPRHTHASVVIYGKILVIGGVGRNDDMLNSVESYDPDTLQWSLVASMNERRSAFQTGVINGTVYVLGGRGGNFGFPEQLMSIEKYCIHEDTWTMVSLPQKHFSQITFV